MSQQSLVKTRGFLVATEYFYVATELAKVKRFCVVTECTLRHDKEFQDIRSCNALKIP